HRDSAWKPGSGALRIEAGSRGLGKAAGELAPAGRRGSAARRKSSLAPSCPARFSGATNVRGSFPNAGTHRRPVTWAARIASVREAQLEDSGSGLTPVTQGWFVVNVRDVEWWFSERRGARCAFESEYGDPPVEFGQFGINVNVLEPGQKGLYHDAAIQGGIHINARE